MFLEFPYLQFEYFLQGTKWWEFQGRYTSFFKPFLTLSPTPLPTKNKNKNKNAEIHL